MLVEKELRRGEIIMTPGETGGYEEVLVLRAPKAAIQIFCLFRRLRGSPFQKVRQTPGYTRGHRCITPKG
jgi:hypothetical protein